MKPGLETIWGVFIKIYISVRTQNSVALTCSIPIPLSPALRRALKINNLVIMVAMKISGLTTTRGAEWVWKSLKSSLAENCHYLTHLAANWKPLLAGFMFSWRDSELSHWEQHFPGQWPKSAAICQHCSCLTWWQELGQTRSWAKS